MKNYPPSEIRNFAIVGHASSGKTMLSEAMLLCAGVITRMGRIADGTTASDYHDSERKHQISVHASLLNAEWMGRKFNIIDAPGSADFISEAIDQTRGWFYSLLAISTLLFSGESEGGPPLPSGEGRGEGNPEERRRSQFGARSGAPSPQPSPGGRGGDSRRPRAFRPARALGRGESGE